MRSSVLCIYLKGRPSKVEEESGMTLEFWPMKLERWNRFYTAKGQTGVEVGSRL